MSIGAPRGPSTPESSRGGQEAKPGAILDAPGQPRRRRRRRRPRFCETTVERCSRCKDENHRSHRYCRKCHAAYMRKWRKTHPMTAEQRMKDNARSYAGTYLRRGKIQRKPCKVKGCVNRAEMHHKDYAKPLEVEWICRTHHLLIHRGLL